MTNKIYLYIFTVALVAVAAVGCTSPAKYATVRHQIADDFVLVCPIQEVLDPSHPCHGREANQSAVDDFVLVCPTQEVLDPSHPCHGRAPAAPIDDFVLLCPVQEVLDPSHPCFE